MKNITFNFKLEKYWPVLLAAIIIAHLFLLSRLIFFPYPELLVYSYLTEQGLVPYKEIFDQHFPGVAFFPINLATLGIDTVYEMRLLQFGLVAISHIFLFLISKKIFKSNLYSLCSNLLYFFWQPFFEGWVLWIDVMVVPLLLASFYSFLGKGKNTLFYVGLFLGLTVLFKQVVGPLILILFVYLILKFKNFTKTYKFLVGTAIPLLFLAVWVIALGIWRDFFYWTTVFNLTTFAETGRKLPTISELLRSVPLFGTSFLALAYSYKKGLSNSFPVLGIFFVASLVFAFARFDFVHLQPALPFSILVLVSAFSYFKGKLKYYLATAFLMLTLSVAIPGIKGFYGEKTLFFGEFEKKLSDKVLEHALPGETVFSFGTTPHLYQLTNTLPPGKVFVFQFPWFMKEAENQVYKGIIIDPPKVVVRDLNSQVSGLNLVSFMPKIDSHIERYYEVVDMVDGVEIMLKRSI